MNLYLSPLAMDFGEWIGAMVPILFFIFWVARQILDQRKQQGVPHHPPKRSAKPLKRHADEISKEIDVFLKQKSEPERLSRNFQEVEVLHPDRTKRPIAVERLQQAPITAEVVRDNLSSTPESDHQDFSQVEGSLRPSRLGEKIEMADEDMEERLAAKFDHAVGSLSTTKFQKHSQARSSGHTPRVEQPREKGVNPTTSVTNMLSTPASIRHAMILNEIFRRPHLS